MLHAPTATSVTPAPSLPRLKFARRSGLRPELNRRVNAYFKDTGRSRAAAGPTMWLKTLVLIGGLATLWTTMLLYATAWWHLVGISAVSGFFLAGIGFSVMHDGNHGAYSERKLINRIMGYTLDLVGGSSYVWRFKHNVMHHTYPNVEGLDDDIEAQPFLRMAEGQRWYPWHRLQHVYFWVMYALLPFKWNFIDDYLAIVTGKLNGHPMQRPRGWDLALMLLGRGAFYFWTIGLPAMVFSVGWGFAVYAIMSAVAGVALGTTFQLAHCVEDAHFTAPPADGVAELPWAEHQLWTTVDFAPKSRFLTWYLGGLNFQVVHHLFPKIGHVHYPAIAKIVTEVCAEYGVTHHTKPTLWQALKGHVRYLKRLGAPST